MNWLDLSRVKNELFRLDQNVLVRLSIPSELQSQKVELFLEIDEITISRDLTHRKWVKSEPLWSSQFDYFYPFTPTRNGSYKFEIRKSNTVLLKGYLSTKLINETEFSAARIVTLLPKFMKSFSEWDKVRVRLGEILIF